MSSNNNNNNKLLWLLVPQNNNTLNLCPNSLGRLSQHAWQGLVQEWKQQQQPNNKNLCSSSSSSSTTTTTVKDLLISKNEDYTDDDDDDDDDEGALSRSETIRRIRTLLEHCPHLERICLPCSYATQLLGTLATLPLLVDVEIHGIPEPDEESDEENEQQEDETTTTTTTPGHSLSVADQIVRHCLQHFTGQVERIALTGYEEGEEYATVSAWTFLQCLESPSLKKIELKAMEMVASSMASPQQIGQALRQNKRLELIRSRCGRVPEAILLEWGRALLGENRTLFHVDIGSLDGVTDAVAQTFTRVMGSDNATFRCFECNLNSVTNFNFVSLKRMFCMDISDNLIGDEGCLVIANCMPGASIERLNFAENGIHRAGASAIAWGMSQCKHLKIVNICDNPVLQESDVTSTTSSIRSPVARAVLAKVQAESAYAHGFVGMLCAALQDHPSMEHLNLASTGLTDAHGPMLALLLRISNLRDVYLGRNSLGDETCGHLYSVLGDDQSTLTSLSLQLNSFTALGFYTIWHGILRTNSRLQSVQIGLRTYNIYDTLRGQRDLDIALRLNRAGRVQLLRDRHATAQDWLECLFRVRDDVDCSFALLRENPSLVTAVHGP